MKALQKVECDSEKQPLKPPSANAVGHGDRQYPFGVGDYAW